MTERPLPRQPVYVISKGRHDRCLTARFLIEDRVPFRLVVEPQERDLYAVEFGNNPFCRIETLPFSNLGLGSIPARNWVWEHSKSMGTERHWILDDNIRCVKRRVKANRIRCESGPALRVVEDWVDRYENIAIAGLQYTAFVPDKKRVMPIAVNHHVYSCLLIRNDLPYRWRGRYNEDTDLCLQVLGGGWCTVLVNAFSIQKIATMTMKGGNTDHLYKGDGRLRMARELERNWPGVVTTIRRWDRPQHKVAQDWAKFDTPLKLKPGVAEKVAPNEYGMEVVALKDADDPRIARLRSTIAKGKRG